MTHQTLQTTARHQALALGLAGLITAGVLSGLLGLAQGDQAAHLAQQMQPMPHAVAAMLVMPKA